MHFGLDASVTHLRCIPEVERLQLAGIEEDPELLGPVVARGLVNEIMVHRVIQVYLRVYDAFFGRSQGTGHDPAGACLDDCGPCPSGLQVDPELPAHLLVHYALAADDKGAIGDGVVPGTDFGEAYIG